MGVDNATYPYLPPLDPSIMVLVHEDEGPDQHSRHPSVQQLAAQGAEPTCVDFRIFR